MFRLRASRSLLTVALLVVATGAAADQPPLNAAVVRFCEGRLGKQVGDGSCGSLVGAAFAEAGATAAGDRWGTPVERADDARPGDIVVFRGTRFLVTGAGGVRHVRTSEHHVAVVARNRGGGRFDLYEQNVVTASATAARRAKTRKGVIDLRTLIAGEVTFVRPQAPPE